MATTRQRFARWGLWSFSVGVAGFYLASLARTVADTWSAAPLTLAPRHAVVPQAPDTRTPRVSIIVPARDEERNIVRCVNSLLAQDYPDFNIIVVDDGSTDATPELLDQLRRTPAGQERLRVVWVDALPAGWAGKPHALHTGVGHADGDWLLFTDADTFHEPGALRAAVARAEHDGADLFSVGSRQEAPDFWNRVLMPIAYMGISFMYPPVLVNNPRSKVAIANGQYLLIRRAVYQRIGGYDTPELRGTVVDDLGLARVVKRSGGRLLLVDGRDLVVTHMYHSLREHWNGWGKNAAIGARGGALGIAIMTPGLPLITVGPFVLLASGLLRRNSRMTLAGAAPVAALLAYRAYLDHMLRIPLRYGWTHPLGGLVFTAIMARSFWNRMRGVTVPWRGRSYTV